MDMMDGVDKDGKRAHAQSPNSANQNSPFRAVNH